LRKSLFLNRSHPRSKLPGIRPLKNKSPILLKVGALGIESEIAFGATKDHQVTKVEANTADMEAESLIYAPAEPIDSDVNPRFVNLVGIFHETDVI